MTIAIQDHETWKMVNILEASKSSIFDKPKQNKEKKTWFCEENKYKDKND